MDELLNIVSNNDEIIGEETRTNIHTHGWFHREIHVYFVTPKKELILQHRALDKDTFPDLLDAAVGGHVEIGDSYETAALREIAEETGLKVKASDLIFINQIKKNSKDESNGKINNVFRFNYLYIFKGNISDLKIEVGKAIGFEAWPLDKLLNLPDGDQTRFIPYVLEYIKNDVAEFVKILKI